MVRRSRTIDKEVSNKLQIEQSNKKNTTFLKQHTLNQTEYSESSDTPSTEQEGALACQLLKNQNKKRKESKVV